MHPIKLKTRKRCVVEVKDRAGSGERMQIDIKVQTFEQHEGKVLPIIGTHDQVCRQHVRPESHFHVLDFQKARAQGSKKLIEGDHGSIDQDVHFCDGRFNRQLHAAIQTQRNDHQCQFTCLQ